MNVQILDRKQDKLTMLPRNGSFTGVNGTRCCNTTGYWKK